MLQVLQLMFINYAQSFQDQTHYDQILLIMDYVYQIVPTTTSASVLVPNVNTYGLLIPANTVITSTSTGTKFITTQEIDFTNTASAELTFVNSGSYLIKKSVPAISAELKSTTISFAPNQKFATANITDTNILQILNVTGSDGNIFYEVPYLAQSTIFQKTANTGSNQDQVPYLLSLQRVPRRFVSRILSDNTIQLEFGAGVSNKSDSQIIPTAGNIQSGSVPGISLITNNYNEASTFFTQEYGLVPSESLTVKYLVGGGIQSNIPVRTFTSTNIK